MSSADLRVNLVPLLVRANGRQRRGRNLDRHIHLAAMADVDQFAFAPDADQKTAHFAQRLLRGGQADPLERPGQRFQVAPTTSARCEPRLSRARAWISSTMTVFTVAQHFAAALAGQQDVKRFGRRDQHMRRLAEHRGPLALRRVAGAHQDANLRQLGIHRRQLGQRSLQILLHVVAERPQRRDIEDVSSSGSAEPCRARLSMAER